MKNMSLEKIAQACGGVYHGSEEMKQSIVESITTDSRQAAKGCLFVAIPGERVDGHDFIPSVFEKGALAVLSEKELENPARDPRDEMPKPVLRTDVLDMKDLKEGMILKGTVRNVIDFGAFVDIGVHQDGLVHISEMTERYIKHPLEAVSVGDVVDVRVIGVDLKKKRISLSMKGIK